MTGDDVLRLGFADDVTRITPHATRPAKLVACGSLRDAGAMILRRETRRCPATRPRREPRDYYAYQIYGVSDSDRRDRSHGAYIPPEPPSLHDRLARLERHAADLRRRLAALEARK